MSDQQAELLKQILEELRAQNEATVRFRAEVHADTVAQRAVQNEQQARWLEEVDAQKRNRADRERYRRDQRRLLLVAIALSAVAIILFAASIRTYNQPPKHDMPSLERIDP